MRFLLYFATYLLLHSIINAQTLSFDNYLYAVRQNHPTITQSGLLVSLGKLEIRRAKGAFDPSFSGSINRKSFNKKEYYTFYQNQIKLPTAYAFEGKMGYDLESGDFINPESKLPTQGLLYAGVSVPLLRGLIIDKKRAELQQAYVTANTNGAQSKALINDLLYASSVSYCEWYAAWQTQLLFKQTIAVAAERQKATEQSVKQGDRSAIDTVEARTQYQNRLFEWNETLLEATNQTTQLSNFLWGKIPLSTDSLLQLQPELRITIPAVWALPNKDNFDNWLTEALNNHPDIIAYNNKLRQLQIEQRLKREYLKPELNVQYNLLLTPSPEYSTSMNNYKLGVSVAVPLLQRTQRSEIGMNKLKIQNTQLDLDIKRQQIAIKITNYYNTYATLSQQINLYEQTVSGYQTLLDAEKRRFGLGETTLLTIFMRETYLLEASIKLIELRAKIAKAQMAVWWAAGLLQ